MDEGIFTDPLDKWNLERLDVNNRMAGYGVNITSVNDISGKSLPYVINQTMMRVDLPQPLKSGEKVEFLVEWNYKIPERLKIGGRGGYELFAEEGNHIFTITQWFPRMCTYTDYQGWNNKQFMGRAEFALPFGNYSVTMNVPADHAVAATGTLNNAQEVLSAQEWVRWQTAQTVTEPIEIITLDEAKYREKNPDKENRKIWKFSAENVRDFAWASSRKFVWDAMPVDIEGNKVMCMSLYAKEAYSLYRKYSTKTVAQTLRTYSRYTVPYPYPVAISVEAQNGMEYPMISFNYGRTNADGTYSERIKNGMISVIIHEVGHNFFPMIINNDERQSSWMDEGFNTFIQFLTEQEIDNDYPSSRGPAEKITSYMKRPVNELEPIMTNPENIVHFGSNIYGKTSSALNILRETVMGRELFDYAFKEYARRWAFRHPTPADFFRTIEDASGVDLDWFWRGWFFDIEPVDVSLENVKGYTIENDKAVFGLEAYFKQTDEEVPTRHITQLRNKHSGMKFLTDTDTTLRDSYYYATKKSRGKDIPATELPLMSTEPGKAPEFYYELTFKNKGGLVTPIIIRWTYEDGTQEVQYIHAYVWRKNETEISKTFAKNKRVTHILLDPYRETADIDVTNHAWPRKVELSTDGKSNEKGKKKKK